MTTFGTQHLSDWHWPEPVDWSRFKRPACIGVVSGLFWLASNEGYFIYNSGLQQYISMFATPFSIALAAASLIFVIESRKYVDDKDAAFAPKEVEKAIKANTGTITLVVILTLLGCHIFSKLLWQQGLYPCAFEDVNTGTDTLVNGEPWEFHAGMTIAAGVGSALFYTATVWYTRAKNREFTAKDWGLAFATGFFLGAGIYAAHVIPGLNIAFGDMDNGFIKLIATVANVLVMTLGFGMGRSLMPDFKNVEQAHLNLSSTIFSGAAPIIRNESDLESNASAANTNMNDNKKLASLDV